MLRNTRPKAGTSRSDQLRGDRRRIGTQAIAPRSSATFSGMVRVAHPQLWSPASPHLYEVTLRASGGASYQLQSGIRAVTITGGHLYLNFRPVQLRGVGLIEDSATAGSALSQARSLRR